MIYQIIKIVSLIKIIENIKRYDEDGGSAFIPLEPNNTDYQTFKTKINDETAELEDANGILMTPEEAKVYVATLP
jgi:hypothetical protein